MISPDRPDVSNSGETVPPGTVQIETGVEYARERKAGEPIERRFAVQTLNRAGITERLELRIGGEPFVSLRGALDGEDHGDIELGANLRLPGGGARPALAIIPTVRLPISVTARRQRDESADLALVGVAGIDFPWELGLDVNVALALLGQPRPFGYLVQVLAAASLSREINQAFSAFAEVFFASRGERGGDERLGVDTGLIYRVTNLCH